MVSAISTEIVIRDENQFSEVTFLGGHEQMHGLELEVVILLIGDPGLCWEFTEVSWNRTTSVGASTTLRLARSERSFGTSTCKSSLDRVITFRGSISV